MTTTAPSTGKNLSVSSGAGEHQSDSVSWKQTSIFSINDKYGK